MFNLTRRKSTAEIAYAWVEKHIDELTKNPPPMLMTTLARTPASLCGAERVHAVEASLRPRLEKVGGVVDLDQAVESGIRCATLAEQEGQATRSWLASRGKP